MQFPINYSGLMFIVSGLPRAVTKFNSDEIQMRDGQPVYSIELLVMGDEDGDKIKVKIVGKPDIPPRTEVKITDLVAIPWEKNGRGGVTFEVGSMEPANAKQAKAA